MSKLNDILQRSFAIGFEVGRLEVDGHKATDVSYSPDKEMADTKTLFNEVIDSVNREAPGNITTWAEQELKKRVEEL